MICSCFFSSNSHVEDLSTLHIDELWMVWMNICQSPVFPLSPLDNHSSRWLDGVNGIFSTFCKAFGEIVRMHLCGILLLEIFLNSPTSRLTAREKRKISFSEDWSLSERALTSSCSILQVSFYFQFLLLKFGLCKKKKNKNTIPRGIKIMKSHIIYYHRCKTEGNKAAVGNMIVSGNSFSNIRKWKCFVRFKMYFTKPLEAKSYLLQLWTLKSLNLSEKR